MKKTMLDYVGETPAALEAMLSRSAPLTAPLVDLLLERRPRVLRIVASGSSGNAAWCARPLLRSLLGLEVLVTPPHSFVHYEGDLPPDELALVVSQSGYSANSLAALAQIRSMGRSAVGITADPKSDMRTAADLLVDYGCGAESVGYVTKGVSTLVLFLQLLALEGGKALGKVDVGRAEVLRTALSAAVAGNAACAAAVPPFLEAHYMELSSLGTTYLCGCGAAYGAALEGALKLCETVQIPAFAYETEEYLHGPELQLTPNHTVFFLDCGGPASPRVRALWQATALVTRRAYLLTCGGDAPQDHRILPLAPVDPALTPLCLLPFFQILSYRITEDKHLWHKHPLCASLEHAVTGKTPNYIPKEVL